MKKKIGGNCFLPSRDWSLVKGVSVEKKAKKPAREFVTKELLIFVGTLRTSTFFYYMRARVSPSSLLQRVVVVCVCVCVCQGNIDL